MNIQVTQQIAESAAQVIDKKIQQLLTTQEQVVLGVCGGRSAAAIFDELQKKEIDWNKIQIFLIDERKVPATSDERNDKIVMDHLKSARVHKYQTTVEYTEELLKQGGYFDIILASMGEDGHIASLFPNHESIKDDNLFFIDVTNSPKPPSDRVSASRKLLLHTKEGILIASGEAKKDAFIQFKEKKDITQLPASLFHFLESATVITDIEV